MRRIGRRGRTALAAAVMTLVALTSGAVAAPASTLAVTTTWDVTSDAPTGSLCPDQTEMTPQVAVNPTNARNVVVAWTQKSATSAAAATGGAIDSGWEIAVAASTDGGRTWSKAPVPGMATTDCTAPGFAYADPSLSFGNDGTLWLAAMRYLPDNPSATNTEVVTTSHDGGRSWSRPAELGYGDRGVIVADPAVPGTAYVAAMAGVADQETSIVVTSTRDGGSHWSLPSVAYRTDGSSATAPSLAISGHGPTGAQLVVAFVGGIDVNLCCTFVTVVTSNDGGGTWTASPTVLGESNPAFAADPATCDPLIPTCTPIWGGIDNGPIVASNGAGTTYVVWSNANPTGQQPPSSGEIVMRRGTSTPGGPTWAPPVVVNDSTSSTGQAFVPRVAVRHDGTVAVTYYDDRARSDSTGAWTGDLWLSLSRDLGGTWQEVHLAGPFDLRSCEGSFGPYVGLTPTRDGFVAADVACAAPGGAAYEGPTDVIATRISF